MNRSGNNRTHTKYFEKQYYASLEKYKSLFNVASTVGFIAPEIVDHDEKRKNTRF